MAAQPQHSVGALFCTSYPLKIWLPFLPQCAPDTALMGEERNKGEWAFLGPGKVLAEATVRASVMVASIFWEASGIDTLKCMISLLGQKQLFNRDKSSALKIRPTLESLATRT